MNTKRKISYDLIILTPIRKGLVNLLAIFLSGCVTPPPYITFSEPKVYSDDQVVTALSGQYRKLQATASNLTAKELQEVLVIKQGTRLNTNLSASPAGASPVTAPEVIDSNTIDLTKLEAPEGDIGLSYSASLRKKMTDGWEVLGRSLFLSGDQTLKAENNNVVLVRFDVSVNNYIPADTFGDTVRFAYIRFTVADPDTGIKIYALEPEYNSTLSKESLITDALEDYRGEIGGTTEGVDIQGAFLYQRALYEGFQKLVEQPLQFAVYGSEQNQFGCALGPIRQIVKRSWINPARIFGNKYRIDHIIEPGARQCYALMVLPKSYSGKKLKVKAEYYRRDFLNKGDLLPSNGPNGETERCINTNKKNFWSCGLFQRSGYLADITYRQAIWGDDWSTPTKLDLSITVPKPNDVATSTANSSISIYPKTTSAVLISTNTNFPLSPDTRVLIGPAEVETKNIELLGRHRLKVTVPPNEALQALLPSCDNPSKKCVKEAKAENMVVLVPGCISKKSPNTTFDNNSDKCEQKFPVILRDSEEKPKPTSGQRDPNLSEETKVTTQKFVYTK